MCPEYSKRCTKTTADERNITTTQEENNIKSTYGLVGYPLASVYSPIQVFSEIYDCETGLTRGTIFSELDLPFVCGGMNGGVSRG